MCMRSWCCWTMGLQVRVLDTLLATMPGGDPVHPLKLKAFCHAMHVLLIMLIDVAVHESPPRIAYQRDVVAI